MGDRDSVKERTRDRVRDKSKGRGDKEQAHWRGGR